MIAKEQAMTCAEVHVPAQGRCRTWRRNGRTQAWVTRPRNYRLPVKYGLYSYGQVTQDTDAHLPADCPEGK